MIEHVLTVACAVFQSAEELDNFGRKSVYARFERGVLACRLYGRFDFSARLFNSLLNACRMNTAVGNESFKGEPCDFSSYRVKAGKRYRLRRIVDYEGAPREGSYPVNVSSLSADDSSLRFVVRERHDGYRRFRHLIRRKSLNRKGNNVFRL